MSDPKPIDTLRNMERDPALKPWWRMQSGRAADEIERLSAENRRLLEAARKVEAMLISGAKSKRAYKDRIKLCEAMGWSTVRHTKEWHGNTWEGVKSGEHSWRLPDPFTDANDDYAVLEWMREQSWYPEKLPQYCFDRPLHSYGVGDYARAALKVLDNE